MLSALVGFLVSCVIEKSLYASPFRVDRDRARGAARVPNTAHTSPNQAEPTPPPARGRPNVGFIPFRELPPITIT